MTPTYIWTKGEGDNVQEVVADERQFDDLTALGFTQKLDSKKKPVLGPTADEIAEQIAKQDAP